MNISLTPELDAYVAQKVQTGMYHSASEVIREGLRLLREQDQIRQARLSQLRQDVDLAVAQIENGQYTEYTADTIKDLADEIKSKGRKLRHGHNGTPS
jgi:antitoxin ParD1/3/4